MLREGLVRVLDGKPDRMPTTGKPIKVALVNDYEIIVHGLAAMLSQYSDRVEIVEIRVRRGAATQGRRCVVRHFCRPALRD